MPDSENRSDSSTRVQIIVALIGLAGVVAAALISNWNNIFPRKASETVKSASSGPVLERKTSERPVHSSGRLTIRGTYMCDLDTGTETRSGADFWWEQQTSTIRFLTPENGAEFYVIGATNFDSVRWSDMQRFAYSGAKIQAAASRNNRIPAGTVVAFRTNEGRLGKLIVDEYGQDLTIRWRTYD